MASKKKQSEGIALLSMYNDEEDDEMEDELAMSPEPEDGGLDGNGRVITGEELQTRNGDLLDGALSGSFQVLTPSSQVNTLQFSELPHTMQVDAVAGSDGAEHGETAQEEQKFVDPLDKFLPPPPKVKCSEDLQRKINKFLVYKKAGKSFNAEVRNRMNYRNPDFLLHAVRYQDIDQIGSCFDNDVFDPHGYDPSDYYDEIEADMRRDSDRKELEKKKAQKVEFASGGAQPRIVTGVSRINVPVAGSFVSSGGLHLMPPTVEVTNRDGRQNKKSKWDKVDGDWENPLPFVGQDSGSTGGVHAAILSAANAGSGYMLSAQQKRQEAEEKRSTERKERRS